MRKSVWLFAVLSATAVAAAPVSAQMMGGRSMQIGVKGGLNFSKPSVEAPEADISTRTAAGGGVFLSIPIGGIYLQPELLYSQKGAKVTAGDGSDIDLTLKMDYIEIPVLLRVPLGSGSSVSPYLLGGGAVSFEASCKFSGESGGISIDVDCDGNDYELELQRKSTDFSAVVGAGVAIPAGSGAVILEGRYTLGLVDLNDSGDSNDSFKNRAGSVFVGYSFTVGN